MLWDVSTIGAWLGDWLHKLVIEQGCLCFDNTESHTRLDINELVHLHRDPALINPLECSLQDAILDVGHTHRGCPTPGCVNKHWFELNLLWKPVLQHCKH